MGRFERPRTLKPPALPGDTYHSVRWVFPSTAERLAIGRRLPDLGRRFKSAPDIYRHPFGLHSSFGLRCPALCRVARSPMHRLGGWVVLRSRGPRSGPGCSVPVRHHLCDPIRPTRRHIATSPLGGLYAMPSLCGSATPEWFRAFADHSQASGSLVARPAAGYDYNMDWTACVGVTLTRWNGS